ncbi:NAP1-binding protein 2 [Candida viswanathii]|uniref:NAP1-binding protein 2 n=1 Tax=Candida viswanathii TaxID=5486 RepID=A0A367YI22_9ASCO|nr:NAP1-binding protein 2 [Candida viswanathii]
MSTPDEINCKARAIFDFSAENDNEISLVEGQIIWISYRHGQGWLVAEDPENGENGLVPEDTSRLSVSWKTTTSTVWKMRRRTFRNGSCWRYLAMREMNR